MAGLSVTSAATEGFQVIKNHPAAVAIWALVLAIAAALAIALVTVTVGFAFLSNLPAMMEAQRTDADLDPAVVMGFVAGIVQVALIAGLIALVVEAVLVTAVKRAVLRPEEYSLGYLRLGRDELRTFLVRFVRGLIFLGVLIVIGVGARLLFGLHPALGVLWCFAGIAAAIFLAVKLSLAVSQSFAERRFTIFGSWALSKGSFWELMGAYVLALIFYIIVAIVVGTIAGLAGGNALMARMMEDPESFNFATGGPLLMVGLMVHIVSSLITETFKLPVLGAPPAAAYRELAIGGPE
jgi:hypothetical protein